MPAFRYRLSSDPGPITVADYRARARRALPDMVWALIDYGADDLTTLAANRAAFARYVLRPRVLAGVESPDLSVTVAGQPLALPVLLAPTGLVGLSHWTGEAGVARAAVRAGTISVVSTASTYTFEEVAHAADKPQFAQLYPWRDLAGGRHDLTGTLIDRARDAGYTALFVTVDVAANGNRESERRRGMGNPPVVTPRRALSAAIRPRWTAAYLRHRRISARNLVDAGGGRAAVTSMAAQYRLMRAELTWDDVAWIRGRWPGPLFVKGLLRADDAQRAVDLGADGVVVSNHGGRQLDSAPASLDALPAIVARVGGQAEVLVDGGFRRGTDVVKALCLGARAVCIGRPYLYGMAAAGPAGAQHVIEIFADEIRRTLILMGVTSVADLGPAWIAPADAPLD